MVIVPEVLVWDYSEPRVTSYGGLRESPIFSPPMGLTEKQ